MSDAVRRDTITDEPIGHTFGNVTTSYNFDSEEEDHLATILAAERISEGSWLKRLTTVMFKLPFFAVKLYTKVAINSFRWWLACWQGVNIVFSVFCLFAIHFIFRQGMIRPLSFIGRLFTKAGREKIRLQRGMQKAKTLDEWCVLSETMDKAVGVEKWLRDEKCDTVDIKSLKAHTKALRRARLANDFKELAMLLRVCCHRNFCGLRDPMLYAHSFVRTKVSVEAFYDEVLAALDCIDYQISTHSSSEEDHRQHRISVYIQLLSDLRLSIGRTALCLSGGGGLSIYHAGVVKTLIEQKLMPRIISGTSGGSIMAAILATRNDDEVMQMVAGAFITESGLTPSFLDQMRNLFRKGTFLDQEIFCQRARKLIGEYTFKEAYTKTKRFVSITTTRAGRYATGDPLVCNVINTPYVLVWSAMVASCSLPLILPPMSLYVKDDAKSKPRVDAVLTRRTSRQNLKPYVLGDMKFVDGSILQDIPVSELQTSFNVKSILVSQVNPHFTPFVQDAAGYKEKQRWFVMWVERVWNYISADIRNRYNRLLILSILPSIRGQDVSPFLMQHAEGHCTIVPANPSDFWKLTRNPSLKEMHKAVVCGERKTWPYVHRLRHMLCIERKLSVLWRKYSS